jgi:hypothetical protein
MPCNSFPFPIFIGSLKLVACFKRTEEGKKWRDIFDQGLAQLATQLQPATEIAK